MGFWDQRYWILPVAPGPVTLPPLFSPDDTIVPPTPSACSTYQPAETLASCHLRALAPVAACAGALAGLLLRP